MRPLIKQLPVSILLAALSVNAISKDYGRYGNVFVIKEEDYRETAIKSTARVDWEKPRKQIRESVVEFKENKKNSRALVPPNKDLIHYVDPSVVAQRDIYAPYLKDGQMKKELIVKKGQRINPLDFMVPSVNRLFINADDQYQLELVDKLVNEYNMPVQVILVRGPLSKVEPLINMDAFFSNPKILDDNDIYFTPSLITVSNNPEYQKQLQVTSLARPFDIDRLMDLITYE